MIALYFSVVQLVAQAPNIVPTTFANIFISIFVSLIKNISKSELPITMDANKVDFLCELSKINADLIIQNILDKLDPVDWKRCCLVSKDWREFARQHLHPTSIR